MDPKNHYIHAISIKDHVEWIIVRAVYALVLFGGVYLSWHYFGETGAGIASAVLGVIYISLGIMTCSMTRPLLGIVSIGLCIYFLSLIYIFLVVVGVVSFYLLSAYLINRYDERIEKRKGENPKCENCHARSVCIMQPGAPLSKDKQAITVEEQ